MVGRHDRQSGSLVAESESLTARPSPRETAASHAGATGRSDPLSDVLRAVRFNGALFFLTDAGPPWVAEVPAASTVAPWILPGAQHLISYHVVTAGRCWCRVAGELPLQLEAGDVVVIPHGDPYTMASSVELRNELPLELTGEFFRGMASGRLPALVAEGEGGGERLHVLCGFLGCDVLPFNPILATMPRLLRVRRPRVAPGVAADGLDHLIEFALGETRAHRAGGDCMLLRISELMFVEVVRRYLETLPTGQPGWLAGLRDTGIGRALALLHGQPERAWTLELLAKAAGLSRSVLAQRFHHFVGQPPMQYLTRWRLQLAAAALLGDAGAKVATVALRAGYDSEAAFSRAFKKLVGTAPAVWRRQHARFATQSPPPIPAVQTPAGKARRADQSAGTVRSRPRRSG